MRISEEEKLMYRVMKVLYEDGIPISFKGSMVLRACLLEAGYSDDTRHTVDIDANWQSDTAPTADQMTKAIENALQRNGIGLNVTLSRMYGEGRSAGLDLKNDSDELLFSMDIDVNRPAFPTKIYEIDGFRFSGVTLSQMMADKIAAVSSDKVFRRIKDVVDLYYLSKVFSFDKNTVNDALEKSGRKLGSFDGFLNRNDELKHSYEKFRFNGNVGKPAFDEVYNAVKEYIDAFLPKET